MFKPNFRYTDKIVGDLTQIAAARQAALKEMNKLVGLKVIRLKGKGRGAYYELI